MPPTTLDRAAAIDLSGVVFPGPMTVGQFQRIMAAAIDAAVMAATNSRPCENCTGPLPARPRPDARFCSAACRSAACRLRRNA
jgi:hypothetical protein